MSEWKNEAEARQEILEKVTEYYLSLIHISAAVFDNLYFRPFIIHGFCV